MGLALLREAATEDPQSARENYVSAKYAEEQRAWLDSLRPLDDGTAHNNLSSESGASRPQDPSQIPQRLTESMCNVSKAPCVYALCVCLWYARLCRRNEVFGGFIPPTRPHV